MKKSNSDDTKLLSINRENTNLTTIEYIKNDINNNINHNKNISIRDTPGGDRDNIISNKKNSITSKIINNIN